MTNLSNYILEKLDTLVVVINFKGQITYVNPSVKKLLGYELDFFIGNSWSDAISINKAQQFSLKKASLKSISAQKRTNSSTNFTSEQILLDSKGRKKYVLWNLSLSPENDWIGIGQDITERKRTELQLVAKLSELKEKNKEVLDSINYSSRIQKAILPDISRLKNKFQDAFVLFKPKDIVSGDFYWFHEQNNLTYVAAIDCTGHGVPGALMTVLANSLLRNIVRQGYSDPGKILNKLDELLYEELNENNKEQTPDGMDIALCVFDFEKSKLAFAGAFRPLILVRKTGQEQKLTEFKASRFPIGLFDEVNKTFESVSVPLNSGDVFYMFSDGFVDQFGGPESSRGGKKFNKKNFRTLLSEIQDFPFDEQEGYLEYVFNNWKQNLEQIDDVCVIGLQT